MSKKQQNMHLGVAHGRATTGTGRANSLEFLHFCSLIDGTIWAFSETAVPDIFA